LPSTLPEPLTFRAVEGLSAGLPELIVALHAAGMAAETQAAVAAAGTFAARKLSAPGGLDHFKKKRKY
jgi:hypothetical protein